ncbi:peptidase M20 [Pacificimonas flava]|uniref:Peptidase M20 n=2 Tax=Pacificimonas TaxID=1960290 RepID=A0A219B0A7_9SPHN|nr:MULTISPECIES: amidohydrolase [Pacificimonas]MBZ6379785.1 amidohydrolase [Pacificimonas aurantium]OWV31761.1 peptidase M20 [Pacificimonas flava]
MFKSFAALLLAASAAPALAQTGDLQEVMQSKWDGGLDELFVHFHQNPELSFREFETAERMAAELRAAGLEVTEGIGGTGVVGILRNGEGPTVLLRADMDGLPVEEDSGLPYESEATQEDIDGVVKPVMHACGHDTHITGLVATAQALAERTDDWSGTALFVVQPAEERIGGAKAMMEDGLYERFPKPDYAIAWHVSAGVPAGKILLDPGISSSSSDSVDITIHGVGAHGASPHKGKDPIVIGSTIVMALQTLVSREIAPLNPGVVTVGSFHSGFKHNIITDTAELQLTVRSDDNEVRDTLIAGIERIATNVGRMYGLPEDRLPEVKYGFESTPVTVNDEAATQRVRSALAAALGPDALMEQPREGMGAEDFAYFVAPNTDVPGVYFSVGGTPPAELEAEKNGGDPVASHHSPFFRVDGETAVTTGAAAMTAAAIGLLQN